MMTEAAHARFDALCRAAKGRSGPGLTLDELADCAALARELESTEPDVDRLEELAARLDLKLRELDGATRPR